MRNSSERLWTSALVCECTHVVRSGQASPNSLQRGWKIGELGLREGGGIFPASQRAARLNDLPKAPLFINGRSQIQVQACDSQPSALSVPPHCLQTSAAHNAVDLDLGLGLPLMCCVSSVRDLSFLDLLSQRPLREWINFKSPFQTDHYITK